MLVFLSEMSYLAFNADKKKSISIEMQINR